MIKFRCPHCDQKLGVPDEYANRRIRCSKCSEPSRVPALANTTSKPAPQPVAASQIEQNSIKSQPPRTTVKSSPAPDETNDLDDLHLVEEESPNQEALRQARAAQRQSRHAHTASPKTTKKSSGKPKIDSGMGGGFALSTLTDAVPDVLRLPLGLAAGAAATGAMIVIWIFASRATASALGFMALLVPLAGAAGLRLFAVEKTFLLALLGTLIGGLGIALGKAAVAKHVVIPYAHELANEEVLVDLKSLLTDEQYQLPQGQSAKFVAQDGDFMQCIALISLVDDGLADPEAARKWALHILLASNKTNIYAHLTSILGSGPDAPSRPELEGEDEAMLTQASDRLWQWQEDELQLQKARQYFPALNCISGQANLCRLLEKPDTAFKFAILETLGLFDVLWGFLGMGLAYVTLALD